jgi:hypothetical protein
MSSVNDYEMDYYGLRAQSRCCAEADSKPEEAIWNIKA